MKQNDGSRRFALFAVVAACALPVGLAACEVQPIIDDPVGEGEGEAGEGEGEAAEGEGEVEEQDDTLLNWSAELPNPYLFPGPDDEDGVLDPVAIDFLLQYDVVLPEENVPPAQLTIEVCMKRASEEEPVCSSNPPEIAVAGQGGYRWGFDPSQYDTGLNVYTHTITLTHGEVLLDEDVLRFEVTAP